MTQVTIAIIYFSGFGHTARQAEAVAEGVHGTGAEAVMIRIPEDGVLSDAGWQALRAADGIAYGSPTYMGGPAWQFKRFADASSKLWMGQELAGKIAGGFTTSASTVGDKSEVISWFFTFAQQHGQIWVGPGMLPSNQKSSSPADVNWTGASTGLMAIAPADSSPDEAPRAGDLETARLYGARLSQIATQKLAA